MPQDARSIRYASSFAYTLAFSSDDPAAMKSTIHGKNNEHQPTKQAADRRVSAADAANNGRSSSNRSRDSSRVRLQGKWSSSTLNTYVACYEVAIPTLNLRKCSKCKCFWMTGADTCWSA
jgi:hypothetical protein